MISRFTALTLAALLGSTTCAAGLELKEITYNTPDAGKVVFSHNSHLKKKGSKKNPSFNCKACHSDTARKNAHFTMREMERGKSCGACHDGKRAFALAKCTRCHKVREITYQVKETGPVVFSHTRHLQSYQCNSCHNRLFKAGPNRPVGMAAMEKGKSCGACHNGRVAFSVAECTGCHPVKEVRYRVKDAGDVPFSHTIHIGMYKCGECHTGLYLPASGNRTVSMGGMEKGGSCGACHDGKTAFTVMENCEKCHKQG